jgi:uncharacterized membrane protein YgcG
MSLLGARAYHKLLTELHQRVHTGLTRVSQIPDQYKPPYVPQNNNGGGNQRSGGGNGGGNSNNATSNNSGGASRQPANDFAEMDDEIPY